MQATAVGRSLGSPAASTVCHRPSPRGALVEDGCLSRCPAGGRRRSALLYSSTAKAGVQDRVVMPKLVDSSADPV